MIGLSGSPSHPPETLTPLRWGLWGRILDLGLDLTRLGPALGVTTLYSPPVPMTFLPTETSPLPFPLLPLIRRGGSMWFRACRSCPVPSTALRCRCWSHSSGSGTRRGTRCDYTKGFTLGGFHTGHIFPRWSTVPFPIFMISYPGRDLQHTSGPMRPSPGPDLQLLREGARLHRGAHDPPRVCHRKAGRVHTSRPEAEEG